MGLHIFGISGLSSGKQGFKIGRFTVKKWFMLLF